MKITNFLGGALFALGLLVFLNGAFNQAAINIVTQFGYTEIPSTYNAVINEFRMYQLGGGFAAVLGAGLACLRKD